MKKLEFKLIANLVTVFLLCVCLAITVSYGWYTNNKNVYANGIFAESASHSLDIGDEGIYKGELGDNPFADSNEEEISGILSGDVIYYSVQVYTNDLEVKNIKITINDINGGEFFTAPKKVLGVPTSDENDNYLTYEVDGVAYNLFESEKGIFYLTYVKNENYINYIKVTSNEYANFNGNITIGDVTYKSYEDTNGIFYITNNNGITANYVEYNDETASYEVVNTTSLGDQTTEVYNKNEIYSFGSDKYYLEETEIGLVKNTVVVTPELLGTSTGEYYKEKDISSELFEKDGKYYYISYLTTQIEDVTYVNEMYINYLYQDEKGYYRNMCDLYTISIYRVYMTKKFFITEDGKWMNYFYYDENDELVVEEVKVSLADRIEAGFKLPDEANGKVTVDGIEYNYYEDEFAVVYEYDPEVDGDPKTFDRANPTDKNIDVFDLYYYEGWDTRMGREITFTFKITFDYSEFIGKINLSSVSNRDLIFNKIIIFEDEVEVDE